MIASSSLIGKGIYPVPDAARLSKVTPRRIRYWIEGRDSESTASVRSPGLWAGQHEPIGSKIVLGFLDLQEVRFVDAFLKQGVSWPFLRRAHEIAKNRYKTDHLFLAVKSGTSEDEVARWYEVSRRDVDDAVEFEKRLAA